MAGTAPTRSGRPRVWRRMLFALVWIAAIGGALVLLWWGMYRLRPFVVASPECGVVDGRLVIAGAVGEGLLAGLGWMVMGSAAWSVMVAAPAYGSVTLLLVFPCSLLPQLGLPVLTLCALVAAVAVIWRYLAGENGPLSGPRTVGGGR